MAAPEIDLRDGHVLVGVDGMSDPEQMFLAACVEADRLHARLSVVTVVPGAGDDRQPPLEHLRHAVAGSPALRGRPVGIFCWSEDDVRAGTGPLREARLVVLGSRGRYDRMPLGLTSLGRVLLKAAASPVLFVPERPTAPGPDAGRRTRPPVVLACVGEHPDDAGVVHAAAAEAHQRGWPLHVVHAHPTHAASADADVARAWCELTATIATAAALPDRTSFTLTRQTAATALQEQLPDAGLLVVGARPAAVYGLVRDSISRTAIEQSPVPVLVVPRTSQQHHEIRLTDRTVS
ncbi:universal stress protein [Spongisporangium articulatum]|uniref:Universal stress protein n=1 Tax=Spongisporangium articulatum TaxID=3362603 RepID=A0ABW8AM19_9ACTN